MENSEPKPSRTSWREHLQALGRDAVAGGVASIVIVANIVSFGTLMFPGDLAAGAASAVWAMLAGAAICGAWIALATTLPPLATGIDSPTGAVLVVLGGSVAAGTLNGGGSAAAAVQSVMLVFSIATAITGALLFGLGALRLGAYFRFVPYFVVAGFLAATGWFLIAGGLRMTTGRALSIGGLAAPWTAAEAVRLAAATATLGVLLGVRRWVKFRLALPAALVLSWVVFVLALRAFDLTAPVHGWYPPSLGALAPWAPLAALARVELPWSMAGRLALETGAVAIVALISLVTKVSTLEVGRKTAGDLDRELRAHGLSSLAAAPLGGITSALQTGTSRLLEHAGAASRWSGVACAAVTGTIALTQFDLLGIVPTPLVAGLVMYLGITFLLDALAKPVAQRAWASVLLAMAIAAACVEYGYVAGVLGGVVCACLLFRSDERRVGKEGPSK
jgi:SulP family sulfate permease